MRQKRILVACEFSGTVRDAFASKGFYAVSCDIRPTDTLVGPHFQGDVRDILKWDWDLIIAHPDCTYLANSGVRWLYSQPGRWQLMEQAAEFFKEMLNAPAKFVAVENPIMHKHARKIIGEGYKQCIQPWQFGHGETKATCLWLRNLPPLQPTKIVEGREHRIHRLPPGPERAKIRSITYSGIALAMAEQWGALLNKESGFTSANIARDEICPHCGGSGRTSLADRFGAECHVCGGEGKLSPVA